MTTKTSTIALIVVAALALGACGKPPCKGRISCTQGILATMQAQATQTERQYHGTPTPTPAPEGKDLNQWMWEQQPHYIVPRYQWMRPEEYRA